MSEDYNQWLADYRWDEYKRQQQLGRLSYYGDIVTTGIGLVGGGLSGDLDMDDVTGAWGSIYGGWVQTQYGTSTFNPYVSAEVPAAPGAPMPGGSGAGTSWAMILLLVVGGYFLFAKKG